MKIFREKTFYILFTALVAVFGFLLNQSYPTRAEISEISLKLNSLETEIHHKPNKDSLLSLSERIARIEANQKIILSIVKDLHKRDG